jgi:hypothetical protein
MSKVALCQIGLVVPACYEIPYTLLTNMAECNPE